MKIVVTGTNGQLGYDVVRNFAVLTRVSYYYMLCGGGIFMYSILGRRSLQVGEKCLAKRTAYYCSAVILTVFITAYSAQVYRAFNGSQKALEFKHDYFYYKNFIIK